MQRVLTFFALVLFALSGCGTSSADQLRDGDIIFHTSRSSQSAVIQEATHSRYSHMGIIFHRNGEPYVFEAVQTVRYTPLKQWIARGQDGHYVVKGLREARRILTPDAISKLRQAADKFQGKSYDLTFEWSDDRIYCSELVWKIYDRGVGVRIGNLQKLRDFDLTDVAVKAKMKERYGNHVPMEETVISPGEMFSSQLLTIAAKH
ncbi:MAG: YiiX family permuted papain-like enzyme [Syntrophotaleaceae bacterium]